MGGGGGGGGEEASTSKIANVVLITIQRRPYFWVRSLLNAWPEISPYNNLTTQIFSGAYPHAELLV